ncbi:MAG: type II toxin-antitoxin system RelE/ParE family toxin [Phyllobacteriaceae bacterium]|jgi:mRNA interferase RelE/StbE|nr:type II toxin-antitoxin system RelE/ParE family toxin [Phyllobacteriaceae bacterium]
MKKVAYSKAATKTLTRMQPAQARRIRDRIMAYAAGEPVDVKRLAGSEFQRIRVGDYRVIVDDDGTVVLVLKVGARGDVYK